MVDVNGKVSVTGVKAQVVNANRLKVSVAKLAGVKPVEFGDDGMVSVDVYVGDMDKFTMRGVVDALLVGFCEASEQL